MFSPGCQTQFPPSQAGLASHQVSELTQLTECAWALLSSSLPSTPLLLFVLSSALSPPLLICSQFSFYYFYLTWASVFLYSSGWPWAHSPVSISLSSGIIGRHCHIQLLNRGTCTQATGLREHVFHVQLPKACNLQPPGGAVGGGPWHIFLAGPPLFLHL